jgi:SAM-dependent methyltransferase
MALSRTIITLLAQLRHAQLLPNYARVVEIGAQQLNNNFLSTKDDLSVLGQLFGIQGLPSLPEQQPTWLLESGIEHLAATAPPAQEFWTWLGFHYASIDIDGSPGSIPLDLNYDSVPDEARGQYDLVTNFGTTEHVANQLNAFEVMHDLAAPGGLFIHEVPAQGYLNHGLVNYNFKFFWMLARSNNYKIIDAAFSVAPFEYGIPENIANFLEEFGITPGPPPSGYRSVDAGLRIVLQKQHDIPYVPPLDMPTGTPIENETLKNRYWTVFAPERLMKLPVYKRPRK